MGACLLIMNPQNVSVLYCMNFTYSWNITRWDRYFFFYVLSVGSTSLSKVVKINFSIMMEWKWKHWQKERYDDSMMERIESRSWLSLPHRRLQAWRPEKRKRHRSPSIRKRGSGWICHQLYVQNLVKTEPIKEIILHKKATSWRIPWQIKTWIENNSMHYV